MKRILAIALMLSVTLFAAAQQPQTTNKAESVESFVDLGFGMFIHWSVDSQLGAVISHSLAGASEEYCQFFFNELPATFNPKKFDPEEWAILAKLAGMEYVVFTAKHHSGFCMFPTKTTDFCIKSTPFKRDITKEIVNAFRAQGIKIGFYYSPEDFRFIHDQGYPIGRLQHEMHYPANNSALMEYDKRQIKELLTRYGKIDVLFFDGPAEGLKEYAWSIQPDVMVTRGEISTPEQTTPDSPIPAPWEACYTMGTDWQYKPTNDPQKDGTTIIKMLIEIRAKGGNFLLNVGPKPDGEIQIEQEALLREIALWNSVNHEAIHGVRSWPVTHEGSTWYTASKDGRTVYAFITDPWAYGQRREFVFPSIRGGKDTKVSVLGHAGELIEYRKDADAAVRWEAAPQGLKVSAVRGQRLYTNNKWPNPVVFKIENVEYAAKTAATEDNGRAFISHRGVHLNYSLCGENSLEAIGMARKAGYNCIENDVRYTRDSVLVILHDNTLNRTFTNADGSEIDGKALVADFTLDQLREKFRLRSARPEYRSVIPTLREYMQECKRQGMKTLFIEPKLNDPSGKFYLDIIREADEVLGRGNYIVTSNNFANNVIRNTLKIRDLTLMGILYQTTYEEMAALGDDVIFAISSTQFKEDDYKRLVAKAHADGRKVESSCSLLSQKEEVRLGTQNMVDNGPAIDYIASDLSAPDKSEFGKVLLKMDDITPQEAIEMMAALGKVPFGACFVDYDGGHYQRMFCDSAPELLKEVCGSKKCSITVIQYL